MDFIVFVAFICFIIGLSLLKVAKYYKQSFEETPEIEENFERFKNNYDLFDKDGNEYNPSIPYTKGIAFFKNKDGKIKVTHQAKLCDLSLQ